MLRYDCVVIGAGPAGLAAASSSRVPCLVLERNSIAGKKLLLSGSGQCNFTHAGTVQDFLRVCGRFTNFLKPAIHAFSPERFVAWLRDNGCDSFARADGKVFPTSLKANDVREAMLRAALANGATFKYNCRIVKVEKAKRYLLTDSDGNTYLTRKLIIAGGGNSWPQTGSDGSCYEFARELDHTVKRIRPALAAVESSEIRYWKDCAGITLPDVGVAFLGEAGKMMARGSLLFTHTGLSGPVVLDNAHLLGGGDYMELRLVHNAEARLRELVTSNPRKTILGALKTLSLPERLLRNLLRIIEIAPDTKCAELLRGQRQRLAAALSAIPFLVSSVEGFDTAMLTAGGVSLEEVVARSLMSPMHQALHFAGEILDYNLPTGGYNIQAAASTGWLAGLS